MAAKSKSAEDLAKDLAKAVDLQEGQVLVVNSDGSHSVAERRTNSTVYVK